MYLCRFLNNDNHPQYGLLDGSKIFSLNNLFHIELDFNCIKDFISDEINISDIQFLPPCEPSKIIGIALNYPGVGDSVSELNEPLVFLKGLNSLALADVKLDIPSDRMVWGECELAMRIKHKIKNISIENVHKSILGFMPANDITCNNFYNRDHHLARSKSVDGFCPVGKYIDLNYEYRNRKIQAFQNNILIRDGNTNDMIFSIEKIIKSLSTWMTLNPGDIILTGAPPRVREKQFLRPDDTYSVRIEGFDNLNIRVT